MVLACLASAAILWPVFFNQDFWQKLVATLCGVAAGIPVALWIERFVGSGKRKAERRELIQAIKETLKRNQELVSQLKGELETSTPPRIPFYSLDLTILNATASRKYELLHNVALTRGIDHARYELIHLDGKLPLLREASARVRSASPETAQWFFAVAHSIVAHLPHVKGAIDAALTSLPQEGAPWWLRLWRWWWREG